MITIHGQAREITIYILNAFVCCDRLFRSNVLIYRVRFFSVFLFCKTCFKLKFKNKEMEVYTDPSPAYNVSVLIQLNLFIICWCIFVNTICSWFIFFAKIYKINYLSVIYVCYLKTDWILLFSIFLTKFVRFKMSWLIRSKELLQN